MHLGLLYGSLREHDAWERVHRPLHGVASDPRNRVQNVFGQLGFLCQVIQRSCALLHTGKNITLDLYTLLITLQVS